MTPAASACSSSASATPAGPLATLAFFDTTTSPRERPAATVARLSPMLGPANRLRVNTPATAAGVVSTIKRSRVSSLMPAVPTWIR